MKEHIIIHTSARHTYECEWQVRIDNLKKINEQKLHLKNYLKLN